MNAPLKLHWWAAKPNFGDAISRAIVARVSGREVAWAKPGQADVFAIGSIMHVVRRGNRAPRADGRKPVVWGTGMLKPVQVDFLENVDVALLRGPISESLLGVSVPGYGDPGLLMAEVIDAPAREDRIGLVPHYAQLEDPAFREIVAAHPVLKLIDVRGDALEVCRQIASCAHVVSSSLHGLIVADSFGVPNTWLNPAGIHASPALKFLDYAAGVERALPRPVALGDLPGMLAGLPTGALPYAAGVARSKGELLHSFPAALKSAEESLQ
ncbi:MAG: polysaccharide pyruvyl transferase family protein [Rhodobacteraceae bacterium]|nr:polysaccharide pyruvyl transferase family protein [Paracoccaceae bacterium]MBR9822029.1 polysaccharide pyruvyl transferase family protein [Paracoccaceae bacterium]